MTWRTSSSVSAFGCILSLKLCDLCELWNCLLSNAEGSVFYSNILKFGIRIRNRPLVCPMKDDGLVDSLNGLHTQTEHEHMLGWFGGLCYSSLTSSVKNLCSSLGRLFWWRQIVLVTEFLSCKHYSFLRWAVAILASVLLRFIYPYFLPLYLLASVDGWTSLHMITVGFKFFKGAISDFSL